MNTPEIIFQNAKQVVLGEHEKSRAREELLAFMRQHPVAVRNMSFPRLYYYMVQRPALALVALVFVVAIGGFGVYRTAQGALPGDALYGVKIHAIEPLQGVFAFTPEQKIRLQLEFLNKRVSEAEALVAQGKLQGQYGEELEVQIEESIRETLARVETLISNFNQQ